MTGSQGTSEGSVSFSLKELMRLEDERIALERDEVRRRREEAERRAAEEAAHAREEAEARAEEEEARRRDEERRAREEAARLEGLKRALVERERLTAEHAARDAEVGRLRQHEIELARLRREQAGSLGSRAAWAVAATSVAALGIWAAVYLGMLKPETDRRVAEARADVAARSEILDKAQKQLGELSKRVDAMGVELKDSQDRAAALDADLRRAQAELARRGGGAAVPSHGVRPPAPIATQKTGLIDGPCKYVGDPLCAGK